MAKAQKNRASKNSYVSPNQRTWLDLKALSVNPWTRITAGWYWLARFRGIFWLAPINSS